MRVDVHPRTRSYEKEKELTLTNEANVGGANGSQRVPRRDHVRRQTRVATPNALLSPSKTDSTVCSPIKASEPLSLRHPLPNPASMARSLALPLLLLALAAVALTIQKLPRQKSAFQSGMLACGLSPIPDVGTADIQKLGAWALGKAKERRLASNGLRFRRVVRGEQQVVAGMNYRLVVDAAYPSGRSAQYVAQVYQSFTSTRKLTSFKPVSSAH
jgi:hypothetical protein